MKRELGVGATCCGQPDKCELECPFRDSASVEEPVVDPDPADNEPVVVDEPEDSDEPVPAEKAASRFRREKGTNA